MAVRAASDQVYLVLSTAVDAAFYRAAYGEAAADPVTDYIDAGWREGRDPAPWFSTADYLAANPDHNEYLFVGDMKDGPQAVGFNLWPGREERFRTELPQSDASWQDYWADFPEEVARLSRFP